MIQYMIVHKLKCFQHAENEAIGICKKCGRGICAACALGIGWDIYCESNADRSAEIRGKDRVSVITMASIILYIVGTLEVITPLLPPAPSNTAHSILPYIVSFAAGIVILGIAYFLAEGLLWNAKHKGSILAFIAAITGIIVNATFMQLEPVSSVFGIMLSIAVIALIAVAWKHSDTPFCVFAYHI